MKLTKKQRKNLFRILLSACLLVAIGVLSWCLPMVWYLRLGLFLIPYAVVGTDVLRKSVINLMRGRLLDENFLMSLATVGALALGEYAEAVFVMLFYQVGELFQSIAVGKSRASIAALMDIRPDSARVLREGEALEVDPEEIHVGEIVEVRAGEKLALDGVVVQGESDLNTVSLTGESVPRAVGVGDEVLGGCVNLTGSLQVRVTKCFGESTVSKILELVENSALVKSRAETAVTKLAHWYTPLVVAGALLLAIVPSLLVGNPTRWVESALIFLVVSCPCALVISVPLSYFGGLGAASRHGILIKGGNYLEMLSQVDTVAFDKTGTLTEGQFSVRSIEVANGCSEQHLLAVAAAAESRSNHPIARAIVKTASERGIAIQPTDQAKELAGQGICAAFAGKPCLVGNALLMKREGIAFSEFEGAGTVVYVAESAQYLGRIVIADRIKAGAREALQALRRAGIRRTVMLSGDQAEIAQRVAEELGLDECRAPLLPTDKVQHVESLLDKSSGALAYVGDGVNDAPVLARADVGIAMGALGSDAAIEAADVVLMDDDPQKIVTALTIARFTRRIVIGNIVFALGVKLGFLALSAFGLTNMWAATFADVGVAVIAILNAMRTLRLRVGERKN